MKLKYEIKQTDLGKTIHQILKEEYHISTRLLTKLIQKEKISLNQKKCDTRNVAVLGDTLEIDLGLIENTSPIVPTPMKIDIVYEDEWMLVLNKPSGIPIHPSSLHYTDSLSNGVRFYFDCIGLAKKVRPVNRLDLDTSGLVVFAKCEYIQECLIHQMQKQTFQKEYLCFVQGIVENAIGKIELPIARKQGSIIEREINMVDGHFAITHYKVLKKYSHYTFVQCKLETGRTHQIRVHMASIGHPILGDTLYGKKSNLIARQALHSHQIQFVHPISKKFLTFQSELPKDMESLL